MWIVYAVLGAFFAALTSILAKIGISEVDSNLATAIRTVVVLILAWIIVLVTDKTGQLSDISQKSWLFLVLSGIATGLSWLFFYRALQTGDVSKVVPIDKMSVVLSILLAFIFLKEPVDFKSIAGCVFIALGTLFIVL